MAAVVSAFKRMWKRMSPDSSQNRLENYRTVTAQRLASFLSPFESYLVSVQSILIWERPYVSAVVLIFCNWLFFWVTKILNFKVYGVIIWCILIVYVYNVIIRDIWPEIKLPPGEGEDTEEWTTINPSVLSVPELSQYMDDLFGAFKRWNDRLWELRLTSPGMFCIGGCLMFSMMAFIGRMIPGIIVVYIMLLTIVTGPGVILHVVPRSQLKSVLSLITCQQYDVSDGAPNREDSFDEFVPEINREHLADLELPMNTSDLELPGRSKLSSGVEDETLTPSLTSGLDAFPDPTNDSSDDEFLPNVRPNSSNKNEEMQFDPRHFNGNESFSQGLSFGGAHPASNNPQPINILQQINASVSSAIIGNLISSTLGNANLHNNPVLEPRRKRAESDASDDSSGFVIVADFENFQPDVA